MAMVTIIFAEQGRCSGVGEATAEKSGQLSVRQRDRDARAHGRVQRVVKFFRHFRCLSRRRRLMARYHLFVLRDSIILSLRVRQKSVAGDEYARLNIGASITRANSENGALPIREGEQARKHKNKKPPRGKA